MLTGRSRRLIVIVLAALIATVAATPAAAGPARTSGLPAGATPIGSPVLVSRANGHVDRLQLYTGAAIYPNTPGADLWYLPGEEHGCA